MDNKPKPTMQEAIAEALKVMNLAYYVLLLRKLGVRDMRVYKDIPL